MKQTKLTLNPAKITCKPLIYHCHHGQSGERGWGGNSAFLDSCEIQVDRADGMGFVLLTIDTTPGYTDTQPFPAAPVTWTYRAIYRVDDAQVGQWSLSVSVTVPA